MESIKDFENEISKVFLLLNDFGHSKTQKFDEYINVFLTFVTQLDEIFLLIRKEKTDDQTIQRLIGSNLQKASEYALYIRNHKKEWEVWFNISSIDYERINPYKHKKKEYTFSPTLPIAGDALEIKFDHEIIILEDKKIIIKGKTNLYDDAELMVSIFSASKDYSAQSKSKVVNGEFVFGPFSDQGSRVPQGEYKGSISLSIPSTQSKEFVEKAGIEYERITGPLVDRSGFSPGVEYNFEFQIS